MARKPPAQTNRKTKNAEHLRQYTSYSPGLKHSQHVVQDEAIEPPPKSISRKVAGFLLIIFLAALAATIFLAAWDARNISAASQKMFGTGSLFDLLSTSGAKTTDNGRTNILLIGYSIDDPGHPAAALTDSIILMSLRSSNKTGYMLSIPRDLYVNIPGYGYGKINEAYRDGGVTLLESIVSQKFGQPINYYALIDYAAVRQTVDALGGVTVNIHSKDPRGLFDPNISPVDGGPLKLSNGPQVLNGQTALNLTRARGDPCGCGQIAYGFAQSDFDRTQNQRQVLTAIKDKLNWKLILTPWKNQRILQAASSNIKTDIKATEIRSLFGNFNSIPSNKLQSLSLRELNGTNYLSSYTTPYGQSALIPSDGINNYSSIQNALAQLSQ
jgi:LCP family protein required for cell wall assembly